MRILTNDEGQLDMGKVLGSAIGILLCVILIYQVIDGLYEGEKNNDEIGIYMSDRERQCYDACNGNDYFYYPGGIFASPVCECGVVDSLVQYDK